MNLNLELLKLLPSIFNALDASMEDYGVYLYLVFVYGWRWRSSLGLSAVVCGDG